MKKAFLQFFIAIIFSFGLYGQAKAQCVDLSIIIGGDAQPVCFNNCSGLSTCYLDTISGSLHKNNICTDACVGVGPVCGNNAVEGNEACDDGNTVAGDGCDENCLIETGSVCGNGTTEAGEECDDNNILDGDGCSSICELEPFCGNGSLETGEECDDGNTDSGDGCDAVCDIEPVCGNGSLETGEECDDGNLINGDGCSETCTICNAASITFGTTATSLCLQNCQSPTCHLNSSGNFFEENSCGTPCTGPIIPVCGNSVIEGSETCDDGNLIPGDGCDNFCQIEPICGNGIIEANETCDDGNLNSGDGCNSVCAVEPICGNGVLEPGEQCDDGNNTNGDSCSSQCKICNSAQITYGAQAQPICQQACGTDICYIGADSNQFFVTNACQVPCIGPTTPVCGDGELQDGEQCDDGNTTSGDGCSSSCNLEEVCGNAVLEGSEECDDGNNSSGDGCNANCELENEICHTLDFDGLSGGAILDNQFASIGVIISAENDASGHPDEAIVFDSSSPTGNDPDLGSPNQSFGGPGIGSGGAQGQPGQNNRALNKVMIIAEDLVDNNNDNLVDDPDDEAAGGKLILDFTSPVKILNLTGLDIDSSSNSVKGFNSSNAQVFSINFSGFGDNSLQTLSVGQSEFVTSKLEINLSDSGAIDEISYCLDNTPQPANLAVRPILECVLNRGNGDYTAFFGHLNENNIPIGISIGPNNFFNSSQNEGQPSSFTTGRTAFYPNAEFSVDFDGSDLVWTLTGPDSVTRTATATNNPAQACTPICGNGVIESTEECDDGNVAGGDGCSPSCALESSCANPVMYAVHDEGSDDSYFFKYDLNTQTITEINHRDNYDIEASATHPLTGTIYGFTGDQGDRERDKKLVVIDKTNGIPDRRNGLSLGIGEDNEYSAASFNPSTNELWVSGDDVGLRTINLTNGSFTTKVSNNNLPESGNVESMAWDPQGQFLYMWQSGEIYRYDDSNQSFSVTCSNVSEIEGMAFDFDGNLVITSGSNNDDLNMDIYDLDNCQNTNSSLYNVVADDLDDSETLVFACEQQFNNPARILATSVKPLLECVEKNSERDFTAHFSYLNSNNQDIIIPVGDGNQFTYKGKIIDSLGQETVFEPGRTPFFPDSEFRVDFDGSALAWSLEGPDGARRTVTATNDEAQRCENKEASDTSKALCTESAQFAIVTLKEVTYFSDTDVISSSSSKIRQNNGSGGAFNFRLWPFSADTEAGVDKTSSQGSRFRIYGFKPELAGTFVEHATRPGLQYQITEDQDAAGQFYIDLGAPGSVKIRLNDLQNNLLNPDAIADSSNFDGTGVLTNEQLNLPGIVLSHNRDKLKVPSALRDAEGISGKKALAEYLGLHVHGDGNSQFSEFLDVHIRFPCGRLDKDKFGLLTVKDDDDSKINKNNPCRYLDSSSTRNAVRLKDAFANKNTRKACSAKERDDNQINRANFDLLRNEVQVLTTVSDDSETLKIYFGELE